MNYTYKRFNTCFISGLILMIERISFAFCSASSTLDAYPNSTNNPVATVPVRFRPPEQWKNTFSPRSTASLTAPIALLTDSSSPSRGHHTCPST